MHVVSFDLKVCQTKPMTNVTTQKQDKSKLGKITSGRNHIHTDPHPLSRKNTLCIHSDTYSYIDECE